MSAASGISAHFVPIKITGNIEATRSLHCNGSLTGRGKGICAPPFINEGNVLTNSKKSDSLM